MADNEWATSTLKEAPFWKDGMMPEEYEKEREYFGLHIEDWQNGNYKPLWKQNN